MPTISLSASVGKDAVNNSADIRAVKRRLVELGFNWLAADSALGPETIRSIMLFQAIKNGFNAQSGKLGAVIVQSLKQNAKAEVEVHSDRLDRKGRKAPSLTSLIFLSSAFVGRTLRRMPNGPGNVCPPKQNGNTPPVEALRSRLMSGAMN